jgi:diguanylate cyclase (GGDEF)-like protein
VLLADVNGFKAVNDRYGHHAGDHVLRELARRLRASVRAVDTVARLGGDEFVVLCEDADAEAAARVTPQSAPSACSASPAARTS